MNGTTEQIFQVLLDRYQIQKGSPDFQVDEEIYVAFWTGLSTRD